MEKTYTLGSLFDGSGGFGLAGTLCGITPVWASEVEPYPIAVTTSRFPNMKHYGDVSKVNGAKIEPVDIITFGSPCQDMSIAGKRAGLKHESKGDDETTRSGLFMEAVRIIKEMRKSTNGKYPRFAIWENVTGAFSSNKGEDFRVVLEELIRIKEPSAAMPPVPRGGWNYADCYRGDGWSLAYRTFDAQYWGVPQRRRRIYLVFDFAGQCAGDILFKRTGLSGNLEQGSQTWQGSSGDSEEGVTYAVRIRGGCEGGGKGALIQEEKSGTLGCNNDQTLFCNVASAGFSSSMGAKAGNIGYEKEKSPTLSAARHDATVLCMNPWDSQSERIYSEDGVWHSLNANSNGGQSRDAVLCLNDQGGSVMSVSENVTATLRAQEHGHQPAIMTFDTTQITSKQNGSAPDFGKPCHTLNANAHPPCAVLLENHPNDSRVKIREDGVVQTLSSRMGTGGGNVPLCFYYDVCYGIGNGQIHEAMNMTHEKAQTLNTMHDAEAVLQCAAVDYRNGTESQDVNGTLQAKPNGGISYNTNIACRVGKTVRRLTPTECARLQGFPDEWGHPIKKDSFSDEEYEFWHEVKNTHDAIIGKTPKKYKKEQLLNWYNKLRTDSSEYKMWGNGIALPCALYCMEGIKESLMN